MKDFEPSQQLLSLALQGIMLSNAEVGFVENLQSIDPIFGKALKVSYSAGKVLRKSGT